MTPKPFARNGDVELRHMQDDDADYSSMARWLSDERVLEFYDGRDNPQGFDQIREKYRPRVLGQNGVVPCIMSYRGCAIGYIQYYGVSESETLEYGIETASGVYGVDLFIGDPRYWGQGIGTGALSALVGFLFNALDASRIVIDPHVTNHRAIRCYEKCGFVKRKLLPKHELHEGEFRDSWLMTIERARKT